MSRERDSQKARVYRAESRLLYNHREFQSVEEVQAFVDKVADSNVWHRLSVRGDFGAVLPAPRVLGNNQASTAFYRAAGHQIHLPDKDWVFNRMMVLHELAHAISPNGAHHNWQFCSSFLVLVRRFLGREMARRLQASFRRCRVRFRPRVKREMSPEQREALRQRCLRWQEERRSGARPPVGAGKRTVRWTVNTLKVGNLGLKF